MGRGRKGRGQGGGGLEDQYGEAGHSQDRQEHSGLAGRGGASAGRGGGDAGDAGIPCLEYSLPSYVMLAVAASMLLHTGIHEKAPELS